MRAENVTTGMVVDIFTDYLEKSDTIEIVETSKMGVISILDGSPEKNRSQLSIKGIESAEDLARELLWFEISNYYDSIDHNHKDPCECTREVEEYVRRSIQPRLEKLPEEWRDEIDRFFANPILGLL